jgi:hypothetical protein
MFKKTERYYAYNTLGLVNQNTENYRALKQAILARNMDLFLSGLGLGTDDFSQFLLINGEVYSIWEIVQDIEKYNEGSSNTPGYKTKSNEPISISIQGNAQLGKDVDARREAKIKDSYEARVNAFKENRYIEDPSKMKVVGYFYPNRFNKLHNALT